MLFQVVTAFGNMLVLRVRKTKNSQGKSHAYWDKGVFCLDNFSDLADQETWLMYLTSKHCYRKLR